MDDGVTCFNTWERNPGFESVGGRDTLSCVVSAMGDSDSYFRITRDPPEVSANFRPCDLRAFFGSTQMAYASHDASLLSWAKEWALSLLVMLN